MTTGSLKFVSLLVVIAAGGGVAWQVQQGILHPQKPAVDATADGDADEADLASHDPIDEASDKSTPRVEELASTDGLLSGWDRDEEPAPRRATHTPAKFQRSPKTGPALGEPIPARAAVREEADDSDVSPLDMTDSSDSESSANDPFLVEHDPPAKQPVRRRTFAASPEPDSTSEELTTPDRDPPGRSRLAADEPESDAIDPFGAAPEVMLTGNHEADSESDAMPPSIESPAAASAEPEADDPFAGAAPPDLSDNSASDSTEEVLERTTPRDKKSPDERTLSPSRRKTPEKTSSRTPTRRSSNAEDDEIPIREKTEPADLQPKLDEPDETPFDNFGEELPAKLSDSSSSTTEETSKQSRKTPKATETLPDEPAPRLLPVPDAPAVKATPRLPTELDDSDRVQPDLGGFGPADQLPKDDELNGDGTPDRDAPKGLQQPRLTIEKIAPKQAVVGQPLIYSVVVKNVGSADAHQVTVEDRIPKGTKLEGTSPRAELIDKKLVWKLGTLKTDEQKKISIKLIPLEQGPIGSVAKVNFVAEVATEIEVTAPQILVSIEAPSQVRLGDKLQLVFKVRNAGRADAQNVIVRNLIPDGLRHPAGADLEYAMGTLPAQDSREIKLDLIATKNGKVANKTIITADGGVNMEEETPVEVVGEQLLLTRTGKGRLFVDKPAVFTSTVANEGTAAATKVNVAEVVPAGFEFVSASDNGKYDPVTRAVTWSVGPIGPGEELKLSTKLMPKNLGDYRATITVTGPAGSVATVDAELKVDGFPAVAVESKSNARLISVGEKATIRIACKNQGTAAAKNLILSAELPPEVKLVDGNGPTAWAKQGNVVTFEAIPHLDPNESATFDLQVQGVSEGDTRIEVQISADHLTRPLRRDETIRVAPEAE